MTGSAPTIEAEGDGDPRYRGQLDDRDHANLTAYAGHVLDAYRDSAISREKAVDLLATVVAAVDTGDYGTGPEHHRARAQANRRLIGGLWFPPPGKTQVRRPWSSGLS